METKRAYEDNIPMALEPYCDAAIVDSRIPVYSGEFTLIRPKETIIVRGEVFYSLECEIRLEFLGVNRDSRSFFLDIAAPTEISTPDGLNGKCIIAKISNSAEEVTFRGFIQNLKPKAVECCRWHWSYLDMVKFHGTPVRRTICSISTDRLFFCCQDGTRILLENVYGYTRDPYQRQISHRCELIPANGNAIDFNSAQRYIIAFSHFISFVVGRYHSPILIDGDDESGNHHAFHCVGYDKSRVEVESWLPFPYDRDIENLWPLFESVWNGDDEDKADILSTAVHWYLEANMGSGKTEGALIMAITGVEMMWNVILDKEYLNGSEQLQALLYKMDYAPSFDSTGLMQTRNQLTHYEKRNRRKYRLLDNEQKQECLNKTLNVLELAILYWLGYRGRFADRLDENKWKGASTKKVPWQE